MRRGGVLAAVVALAGLGATQRRGQAAVMIDASLQASVFDQPELETPNFTVGSGPKRLLLVSVALANPAVEVGSVRWKGVPLTLVDARTMAGPDGFCHLQLWMLVEPAAGSNPLSVALSGASAFGLGAVSYTGVDPRTPLGPVEWASGIGGDVALHVAAPGDRPVLAAACLNGPWITGPTASTPAAVVGPEETAFWNFTEPGVVGLGSHRVAMNGLGRVHWLVDTVDPFAWLALGVSIKPDGELLPDAGPDAPRADARVSADAADAGTEADAAVPDAAPAADGGFPPDLAQADVETQANPDAPAVADVRLRVGCACRTGGPGGGDAGILLLGLGFLAARRRRRR